MVAVDNTRNFIPFMFITIACGAISGFHAIVSSGTTSKMIEYESEIKMIGFGAMLVEGFVSVIALIAATILIPGTTLQSILIFRLTFWQN